MQTPEVLNGVDVARAFKEEDYRASLTQAQKEALQSLLDQGELSDELLEEVAGGANTRGCITFICAEA
jgi:hypothetical protein